MSKNQNLAKTKGIPSALMLAFSQGWESILFNFFAVVFIIVMNTPQFATASLAAKELLALGFTLLIFGKKHLKSLFPKIKSKQFLLFALAGLFGTSFGNLFYILAIALAGPGYGVILVALYPIFTIILINIFSKTRDSKEVWIGASLTIIGGILFVVLPIVTSSNNTFNKNVIFGMVCGLVAAFFWALESFLIKIGMKGKFKFSTNEIIITRSLAATLVSIIFFLPLINVFKFSSTNSFTLFNEMFTNWKSLLIILAMALNVIIIRFFHIKAIKKAGVKITTIIDNTSFIFPSILAYIFQFIPGAIGDKFKENLVIPWAFALVVPIIIGVVMVVYYHKNNNLKILDREK